MIEKYLLLVEYDNCTTEYIPCSTKREYIRKFNSLKQNTSIEYIKVLSNPKPIQSWVNPNCSPETSWI
jgi:hypothetical protein